LALRRAPWRFEDPQLHCRPQGEYYWITGVTDAIRDLKAQPGKTSGGVLFRSLLDAGLVDTVEVAVIPVLIGSGIPILPDRRRAPLHLEEIKAFPSGILMLKCADPTSPS
jgi:dihydrofolate reductase